MNQFRDFSDIKGFSNQMMTDKTNINSSNDAQQFAPSFLFGSQQTARRSFTSKTGGFCEEYGSPGILRKRELSSGTGKTVHWSPVLVRSRSKSPDARKLHRLSGGKSASTSLWNGPPLRSLNEEIVGPPSKLSRLEPSNSQPEQSSFQSIGGEQVEIESEEVGNGSDVDFHWVTVFGFKHDHRDDVLELFSRHGDIMAQRTTKDGNWVHIRYSSPIHARQALSKNATLFRGQMIGVVPCRERDALTAQETTIPTRSNGNNFNGSCSFLENDMSSLLHVNNGDTPTRLISSTSICKEDSSVPRFFL
uniref:Nucleoporin NUP35 n=1 Tax=Meloidogyne hapla TaxID=6305 RepID=A0A1I8B3B2_MELHA